MQPEQVLKVRGDLGVTQQNMAVFSEMLSELKPGLEHPEVCIFASNSLSYPGFDNNPMVFVGSVNV